MNTLPLFVSAGEALTDMVRTGPDLWTSKTGGAGLNVARAMARLAVPSAFAGAISNDVFGLALQTSAQEAGLDPRFLQLNDRPPLLAVVPETAPPDYFFIGENSADQQFAPWNLPAGWEREARWVHFGGISLARPPLADRLLCMASSLKSVGVKISYDPNFRKLMDERYDPMLHKMAALADVIKVSDEDLIGLFRTDDVRQALTRLRALNPEASILLTRGADGAEFHTGQQAWRARPPAITVADTIGAGDASICALLYSLMQQPQAGGMDHLRMAVAAGAAACTQAGAVPPTLNQIEALAPSVDITPEGSISCAA
ncbi:fructokinase [Duganella sp. CF402]|uniref:carbohydrate kinase family protein n=1 Tax=unclassified Duganella TaxID=2636909 RepID=UPI0008CDE079|nr:MULTISPECIES: carbohydrate kinase [unclassified Duganella]RZT06213.1 fructokinase [Duganella sp. BK701]SEM71914.1 fructokinase [Duganella sp. CF402]